MIMLSGNYNFFNFLYLALCLSLADNSWLEVPTTLPHLLSLLPHPPGNLCCPGLGCGPGLQPSVHLKLDCGEFGNFLNRRFRHISVTCSSIGDLPWPAEPCMGRTHISSKCHKDAKSIEKLAPNSFPPLPCHRSLLSLSPILLRAVGQSHL